MSACKDLGVVSHSFTYVFRRKYNGKADDFARARFGYHYLPITKALPKTARKILSEEMIDSRTYCFAMASEITKRLHSSLVKAKAWIK